MRFPARRCAVGGCRTKRGEELHWGICSLCVPKIQTGIHKSWAENSVCVCLTRRCFAAGPELVNEAESGLQLTAVCQGSQAQQKDTAGETLAWLMEKMPFLILHTLNPPEKSYPTERLLPSHASPHEEGFNHFVCLSLSAPADVSLNRNFIESSLLHFIQV